MLAQKVYSNGKFEKESYVGTKVSKEKDKRKKAEEVHVGLHEWQAGASQVLSSIRWAGSDKFNIRNSDPIWLHQNEMWECMETDEN